MELRQLEYFIAVAEEGGFTRAADRVHISQSGVSAQLRQLERELGAELIDRSTRVAKLTAAGGAALEPARTALAAAQELRGAVDAIKGLVHGRVAIGMVTGCTLTPLFDAIADFSQDHPGVEIELCEAASDQIAQRLCGGDLDVGVLGAASRSLPDLESSALVAEPVVAAAPPTHPLHQRREPIALADLIAHPLVCMPRGTGIRTVLDQACADLALSPNVALEASAPGAVRDLAARGLGVAVLSQSMFEGEQRLRLLPVADLQAPGFLLLAWRKTPSHAARVLIEHCNQRLTPTDPTPSDGREGCETGP